jgi:altronate dehydratase large subunit
MLESAVDALPGWQHQGMPPGIRRHLLVIPSVICAAQAALIVAEEFPGAVAIEHQHGCAQLGGDARLTEQVLTGLGAHPNVAGALVVSLGCETVQGVGLQRAIVARGQRAELVGIQQAGGTGAAIRAGRQALARLQRASAADPQVTLGWADLCVGIEAAWLGVAPAQSRVFREVIDRLLDRGATVVQAIRDGGTDAARRPEGTVTIGAGTERPARVEYAARPSGRGLFLMESPASRIAQKTGLAAAGAHVIISPLTAGLPAGCPVAPVVHVGIAPYARPFARDVDAMLEEDPRPGAAQAVIAALQRAVCAETTMEALGTFEMAIHRIAPTM